MSEEQGRWKASSMTMTKEAWAELNGDHEITVVVSGFDGFTGEVVAAVWDDGDQDEKDVARLIAAAPDLLYVATCVSELGDVLGHNNAVVHLARAAISRAKGQSNA